MAYNDTKDYHLADHWLLTSAANFGRFMHHLPETGNLHVVWYQAFRAAQIPLRFSGHHQFLSESMTRLEYLGTSMRLAFLRHDFSSVARHGTGLVFQELPMQHSPPYDSEQRCSFRGAWVGVPKELHRSGKALYYVQWDDSYSVQARPENWRSEYIGTNEYCHGIYAEDLLRQCRDGPERSQEAPPPGAGAFCAFGNFDMLY